MTLVWTEYLRHRARTGGFDLAAVEQIVRFSEERYFDTATQRMVAVGHEGHRLVRVPSDQAGDRVIPITVHATTRHQIGLRLRSGRFRP